MIDKEKTMWGIHAGKTGDADTLFLKKKYIALGWTAMGNLSKIQPNRESFKEKVKENYPEKKRGAIPINAGQLFRFVHEMKVGDLIIYPSKQSREIHIGEVIGNYKYSPNIDSRYPHQRSVKWVMSFPRTHFSQGALYEIGSAISLFQVKNYADDFLAALEGRKIDLATEEDETVGLVAEEIEETTRDFILKILVREIKGRAFEEFVGHLLNIMGYRTRMAPEGPDGGIDILAHKDELGLEPPIVKVQVKSSGGNVGDPEVSALYGKVGPGEYGLLVTIGSFTKQALNFAKEKTNLRLIDGTELVGLILQHYKKFDSKYRGLIPLKKIYIPESIEKSD